MVSPIFHVRVVAIEAERHSVVVKYPELDGQQTEVDQLCGRPYDPVRLQQHHSFVSQVSRHLGERRPLKTAQHDEKHRYVDGREENLIEEELLHDGHDGSSRQDILEEAVPVVTHWADDRSRPTHVSRANRVPVLLSLLHLLVVLLKGVARTGQTHGDDGVS